MPGLINQPQTFTEKCVMLKRVYHGSTCAGSFNILILSLLFHRINNLQSKIPFGI